ncbi:MAG: hypothetical protein WC549_00450 [Actinomycetota bacterium]
MKKFRFTARAVDVLEEIIEAETIEKAEKIAQEHLENGSIPIVGEGYIDNEELEEIK